MSGKALITNKLLVEATGVELFNVLTARKLLIPGIATGAKKAPLPNRLYVYCTKMLFARESHGPEDRPKYPTDSPHGSEKIRQRFRLTSHNPVYG